MKVAMYYRNDDIRIQDASVPKIGPGEILMKVEASGICGSDVMEWYRLHKVPLVLGHEVSGVIAEVGAGVKQYKTGQRIAATHHVPCGACHYCQSGHETTCETLRKTNFDPGGFAEYIRLPAVNVEKGVFVLPDKVGFEEATFVEPLACVLRAQRLSGIKPAQTVLIIGSGISGILHIQMARLNGASRIIATDINDYRLRAAKKFGADFTVNAQENLSARLREINEGRLADVVILCAGAISAINQALESVDRGGVVLFFSAATKDAAINLDINKIFWRNEITLTSSYGGSPEDCCQALALIAGGKLNLKDMITHRLPLERTGEGFKLVAEAKESLKVIIEPNKVKSKKAKPQFPATKISGFAANFGEKSQN